MKILVTGGAGYIGSILVPSLLIDNHEVHVLDNFRYGENSLAAVCSNKRLEITKGDTRDTAILKELVKNVDVVIPLAAIVGAPACDVDPITATSTNRDAIHNLLRIVSPNQWIIMPTTNSAYGTSAASEFLDEDAKLNPLSLYARDKVEVEIALTQHNNFTSFRLATVFGMSPRMRLDLLVNNFVKSAINPGYLVLFEANFRRNFIHIRDVAYAFTYALQNHNLFCNEVFNVGMSNANLSKRELADKIKQVIPNFVVIESEFSEDKDKRDYLISNAKIEKTGFAPKFSLDDGIEELRKGITSLQLEKYSNL